MAWLGEAIDEGSTSLSDEHDAVNHFRFRCTKDRIEEALFDRRRDLFSSLGLVFFDTTSICFEGEGGQDLGQRGFSKDHRPDLKQMIVGAVIDDQGAPICWMRSQNEVRHDVLSRAGRYKKVHREASESKAPSPLEVKDVRVEGRRYLPE